MNSPVEKTEPVGYVTADIINKLENGVAANHSDISRIRSRDFQVALYSSSAVEELSSDLARFKSALMEVGASHNSLASELSALKAENAALLSRVERVEKALTTADAAITYYLRYLDGGETRGSYDGKPERNALGKAGYATHAALQETKP